MLVSKLRSDCITHQHTNEISKQIPKHQHLNVLRHKEPIAERK